MGAMNRTATISQQLGRYDYGEELKAIPDPTESAAPAGLGYSYRA
jgi:hypothetical protein